LRYASAASPHDESRRKDTPDLSRGFPQSKHLITFVQVLSLFPIMAINFSDKKQDKSLQNFYPVFSFLILFDFHKIRSRASQSFKQALFFSHIILRQPDAP
jgi:hypothetical protein